MQREEALLDLRYAKYITVEELGIVRVFVSLREIQAEYGVNYSTISKCIGEDGLGCFNSPGDSSWVAVRQLSLRGARTDKRQDEKNL